MGIARLGRFLTPIGFAFCLTGVMSLSWPGDLGILSFSPLYVRLAGSFLIPQFAACVLTYGAWTANAWLRPVAKKLKFSIMSSLITAAGVAALTLFLLSGQGEPVYLSITGILVGAGLSSSMVTWIRVFSTNDFYYSSTRIVAAVAIASLIQFGLNLIPGIAAWGLLATLLLASCVMGPLCINSREFSDEAFHHRPCENRQRYAKQFARLWRPVLFALAAAIAWGVMQAYNNRFGPASDTNLCLSLGMLLTSVTLAFIWSIFNNRYGFIRVFRILTLVFLIAFLAFFFIGAQAVFALTAFSSYAFSLAWLLMMLICTRDAQNKEVHPFIAWGIFASLITICSDFIGYEFGLEFAILLASGTGMPLEAVLSVLCIAVFFLVLYIDDRRPSGKDKEKGASASEEAKGPDALEERCTAVAQAYGLSPREREVFTLLARGRDVYHISEELFVSTSTVQFHCKNIYRKLDIHRKQDLITMVDRFEG